MIPGTKLGIVVNPMSGRDVRRVAARASTSGHHEKQQQVTRLVLAAFAQGVSEIYLANEPFRINVRAVENLPEKDRVKILEFPLKHSAADTESMVDQMWQHGCRVFIVLGGDGTNRIVARRYPDAIVLPLSTGTNNVFPIFVEASVAGSAAGLIAAGKLPYEDYCLRCKQVHIDYQGRTDIALIDAVLLRDDSMGSLLPFTAEKVAGAVLTRAEPASVGISPIGGFLHPCYHPDDFGVYVDCESGDEQNRITVPISPGLHQEINVTSLTTMELDHAVLMKGPGILAFDGDRTFNLDAQEVASLKVSRDGPWIIDPHVVLHEAATQRLLTIT